MCVGGQQGPESAITNTHDPGASFPSLVVFIVYTLDLTWRFQDMLDFIAISFFSVHFLVSGFSFFLL